MYNNINKLINHILDKNGIQAKLAMDNIVKNKLIPMIDARKQELAQNIFKQQ